MPPESSHEPALLAGTELPKHFTKTGRLSSRTGREGGGMRGSQSADEPYHLYIASIALGTAGFWGFFFNVQNI